jgi:crossover junction endodeoxyribonuclease RuvC
MGVDPGSRITGYGVVEERDGNLQATAFGVITPRRDSPIEQRLLHVYSDLAAIIGTHKPDTVAIEDPYVGKNPRAIFALGQAQAVVLLACAQLGLPVFRYAPAQIKQAVADYGAATKEQVADMVRLTLRLPDADIPEDATDALAVALCHLHQLRAQDILGRAIGTERSEVQL